MSIRLLPPDGGMILKIVWFELTANDAKIAKKIKNVCGFSVLSG